MTTNITLAAIRDAAQRLANAHNDTAAAAALLNAELKAAAAPILDRYRQTLDQYAHAEAEARTILEGMLIAAPNLFREPRSLTVDGVKCGYKREPDGLTWKNEEAVIAAIEALLEDKAPLLIRTDKKLIHAALGGLDADQLQMIGVNEVKGADRYYVIVGPNDADTIAQALIADAQRRQGDADDGKAGRASPKAKGVKAKSASQGVPA